MEMSFKCIVYSWDDVYSMCETLGKAILDSGFRPEVVVAIARGGWVPARILCDILDVKDLYSVKAEHWGKVATASGEAKLTQPLNVSLEGRNVLLVDDVTDTGETILLVSNHLRELGARRVRIAVLDHKKTSKFVPDYFVKMMDSWKWIVYPWSFYEDTRDFIGRLSLKNKTLERIKKELKEKFDFEVSSEIIEYVLGEYRVEVKVEVEELQTEKSKEA
jgi:hypothetical protein